MARAPTHIQETKELKLVGAVSGSRIPSAEPDKESDDANLLFSHEVLALRPNDLTVMQVSEVGWSDLGEPKRVFSTLQQIGL